MDQYLQADHDRLEWLESIVERGQQTFIEVGKALAEIRDSGLYKKLLGYSRFEDYCQERWGWSRQRASQLIQGAEVAVGVSTEVDKMSIVSEAQARPLTKLKTSDEQYQAWTRANEIAEEESRAVTREIVNRAVEEIRAPHQISRAEVSGSEARDRKRAFDASREATNILSNIPIQNPFRAEALEDVRRWIEHNQEG